MWAVHWGGEDHPDARAALKELLSALFAEPSAAERIMREAADHLHYVHEDLTVSMVGRAPERLNLIRYLTETALNELIEDAEQLHKCAVGERTRRRLVGGG